MERNPQTLRFLYQCFVDALSPLPEPRLRAESNLIKATDSPNYALAVLQLVAEPSVDEQIRQAAAVNFKNHLRARWSEFPPTSTCIPNTEKNEIKARIVPLMLLSSRMVQSQLSEAIAVIIGKHEIRRFWPALLPELCSNLEVASKDSDYDCVYGILDTLNYCFKKFRYEFMTEELLLDLKYCLDHFAQQLLEVFDRTEGMIKSVVASGVAATSNIRPLVESQRLCCRIFYSLNFQDLPEFFEDNMDNWMSGFKDILTTDYHALEDDGLTLVDGVRAAVCENITHLMVREEELFQKYLSGFVEAVWNIVVVAYTSFSRDRLTVTAIKFLSTVIRSNHNPVFPMHHILQLISQSSVIANILRDEDEFLI